VVAVVFFGPGGDASVDLPATRKRADAAGKLAGVRAPLPEGATDVVVVVDLFPVLDAAVPP
jgi:hypothetical protein